jgi:hypothetical protein
MRRPPLSAVTNSQNHILKSLDDSQGNTQQRADSSLPSSKRKRVMFDPSGITFPTCVKLNYSVTACGKTRDEPQHAKEKEIRRNH